MDTSHLAAFGQAMALGDIDAAFTHVSDQVELHSPIFDAPFVGKAAVGRVMGAVTIGDVTGNGIELIQFDAEGLIDRITVFWRPLRLGLAGQERLAPLLGRDRVI